MAGATYYPIYADLRGRRCVIIGGGPVAHRKATTLLRHGAQVTVISPLLTPRLATRARAGAVRHIARTFRASDLRGAWLAYACTDDQRVNERVARAAREARLFANVVDQPSLCSFIAPAILRRGRLTVAVSTGGASPTFAKHLRRRLAACIGGETPAMLRLLAGLRTPAKRVLPRYEDRKRYFHEVVEGAVAAQVRAGRHRLARRQALTLLHRRAATRTV